jgi:hypothetical protein
MKQVQTLKTACLGVLLLAWNGQAFGQHTTNEDPMIVGNTPNTSNGWQTEGLVTIGETNSNGDDVNMNWYGYRPVGILDGLAAYKLNSSTVRFFANHELSAGNGYSYSLANGTTLTGARVSAVDIKKSNKKVLDISLAYDKAYDRYGNIVTSATQINEGSSTTQGFDRLCSSFGALADECGLVDDIYFTGEETSNGQQCALNIESKTIYVVPMMGRAQFENVTIIENFGTNKVAFIIGDDRGGAPLLLYIGEKGSTPAGPYSPPSWLKTNGLGNGHLYVWVSDNYAVNGENTPVTFNATGSSRTGKFVKVPNYIPANAGLPGYDAVGFSSMSTLDVGYAAAGAFKFSRPEDIATNPHDGTQVVFASTGLSSLFGGVDTWGTTYLIDFNDAGLQSELQKTLGAGNNIPATITILYHGDDAGNGQFAGPDYGLRNPDNLCWANNGYVYIQEDRSVAPGVFGGASGVEASVWQLDPSTGTLERILEMDRTTVPFGQTDNLPADLGNWESSGVIDVTHLFNEGNDDNSGEDHNLKTLLLLDVQTHSITTGPIGGSTQLVEGGQLLFASKHYEEEEKNSIETGSTGHQPMVYPNPATLMTEVHYTLDEDGMVRVEVLDITGRCVAVIASEFQHKGAQVAAWYMDTRGARAIPGEYIIRILTEESAQSLKLTVQ